MTDIPIIFSGAMVRALLDGRKTMTRRLASSSWARVAPGDRLWVREAAAWINNEEYNDQSYWEYRADTNGRCFAGQWPAEERDNQERPRWKPSIHMPRLASRITLLVSATRVESLCDMPPDDAIAEGMKGITKDGKMVKYGLPDRDGWPGEDDYGWPWDQWRISPVDAFEHLWCKLHGEGAWGANPKVVALTFGVHKSNIDALATAHADAA